MLSKYIVAIYFVVSSAFVVGAFVVDSFSVPRHARAMAILNTTRNPTPYIINGTDASVEDHPHQISLKKRIMLPKFSIWYHACGGSLVATNWVVTAAHCVFGTNPSDLRVDLNDGRLDDPNNEGYAVSHVEMHPGFNYSKVGSPNDIALLGLVTNVDFSRGHDFIDLAITNEVFEGRTCEISGWGYTVAGTEEPNQLQQTDGVVRSAMCRRYYGRKYNPHVHICLDNKYTGGCQGDSGGPMVCMRDSTPVLAGITSWGTSDCNTTFPSVYTRVSTYSAWLYDVMELEYEH